MGFERVNAFFQAADADPEKMHKELLAHGKCLKARIYDAQGNIMKIDQVDFGGKCKADANKYLQAQGNSCSAHEKVHEMKR